MPSRNKYNKQDKLRVAISYQMTGCKSQTAKDTGIARTTIAGWITKDEEFGIQYQVAIEQGKKQLDAKLSSLIDDALQVLKDKLQNPEKISARDAATISAILYDKRALSRNMPTSISTNNNKGQLSELASVFDKLVSSAKNSIKDVNGNVVSVQTNNKERQINKGMALI